jgi:hypothetical protein
MLSTKTSDMEIDTTVMAKWGEEWRRAGKKSQRKY